MSNFSGSKRKTAINLEVFPQFDTKNESIELIKKYLLSQPDQIKNLENISNTLYEVINKFIDITKDYTTQLEILALSIIPNNNTEGQFAQSVQAILLFYLEGLNNLISELKKAIVKTSEEEINDIINQINKYKNEYFIQLKEVELYSENYRKEMVFYQEYLVNNKYKEHIKRGDFRNFDDEIININERNRLEKIKKDIIKKKEELNLIKDFDVIDEYYEFKSNDEKIFSNFEPINDEGLNIIDNEKELIESEKKVILKINERNDELMCIKKYLSEEKTNLRKNIFRMCDCFIEGLLNCAKAQKENCDIQNDVIKNLKNILNYEETDKNEIIFEPMNLKYLEIYDNFIKEKSESKLNDNNTNNSNNTSDQRKKNNLIIKSNGIDNLPRNTISFLQKNNTEEIIEEKFKSMVTKLNRDEILNIFEKIRNTKINLCDNDLKLIEHESNYKIIHDIIATIFINSEKYTEKEKKILIDYFEKDKIYVFYFIKILNDHRTKGIFILSEKTIKLLGELFEFINNLALSKKDMELFKFIFILSMTYYYISEKNNLKIYLFSYIKDHPDYQKTQFWENYLYELINHDLKASNFSKIDLTYKTVEHLKRGEKEKLINCYFSNFLSVTKAMADFRLDKQFVRDFVEKNKEKYFLSEEQIENICLIFDVSLIENEKIYNGDLNKDKENMKEVNNNIENKEDNKTIENNISIINKNNINIEDNSEFDNENNQTNNETI